MLGTIAKAGRVLDLFCDDAQEWGVTEVAAELGVAKSSAHAILATLCELGLVRRTDANRYRLGWRIMELHRNLVDATTLLGPSHRQLQQVADGLNATAHVGALKGQQLVLLDEAVGGQERNFQISQIGHCAPAACTALGTVLLAYEDRESDLSSIGPAGGPSTIQLTEVVRRGYAVDMQGWVTEASCIAVPIFDLAGNVQTAISIAVPATRFGSEFPRLRRMSEWLARDVTKARLLGTPYESATERS